MAETTEFMIVAPLLLGNGKRLNGIRGSSATAPNVRQQGVDCFESSLRLNGSQPAGRLPTGTPATCRTPRNH
jgi:hypothetical protein